jgi:hypothetical protein
VRETAGVGTRRGAPLLAAILLAGCGGGGSHHPANGAAKRPRSHGPAARAPTRDQALAFARAVNLTAADLPGFRHGPKRDTETQREKRFTDRLRRCAGVGGSASAGRGGALAERDSGSFRLRRDVLDLSVSSEVSVERRADLAARELAVIRSRRVRDCFASYLNLVLRSQSHAGATLKPVSIQAGTPPAPGATGSFGWRITEPFTVRGVRLSLYVDILGFVIGPARVTLVSSGAVRPFPAGIQQRLFALLLARASAQAS